MNKKREREREEEKRKREKNENGGGTMGLKMRNVKECSVGLSGTNDAYNISRISSTTL